MPWTSLAAMAVTLAICALVPVGGFLLLLRRFPDVGRAFGCGMLAFVASQVLTRIPLMAFAVPLLPEPIRGFLLSVPVASFTAGLFEETGRLVVMLLLLKRFHRLADGLAFGLGHGGIEAILLVGLTYVNNLVISIMINSGGWASIAKTLPPETATKISDALTTTPALDFLSAGVERIGAIALHTTCSLVILAGIVHGRKLLAWLAAFALHGVTNLVIVSAAVAKVLPTIALEVAFVLVTGTLLWLAIRRLGPTLPSAVAPDLRRLPPPSGPALPAA